MTTNYYMFDVEYYGYVTVIIIYSVQNIIIHKLCIIVTTSVVLIIHC